MRNTFDRNEWHLAVVGLVGSVNDEYFASLCYFVLNALMLKKIDLMLPPFVCW